MGQGKALVHSENENILFIHIVHSQKREHIDNPKLVAVE